MKEGKGRDKIFTGERERGKRIERGEILRHVLEKSNELENKYVRNNEEIVIIIPHVIISPLSLQGTL